MCSKIFSFSCTKRSQQSQVFSLSHQSDVQPFAEVPPAKLEEIFTSCIHSLNSHPESQQSENVHILRDGVEPYQSPSNIQSPSKRLMQSDTGCTQGELSAVGFHRISSRLCVWQPPSPHPKHHHELQRKTPVLTQIRNILSLCSFFKVSKLLTRQQFAYLEYQASSVACFWSVWFIHLRQTRMTVDCQGTWIINSDQLLKVPYYAKFMPVIFSSPPLMNSTEVRKVPFNSFARSAFFWMDSPRRWFLARWTTTWLARGWVSVYFYCKLYFPVGDVSSLALSGSVDPVDPSSLVPGAGGWLADFTF